MIHPHTPPNDVLSLHACSSKITTTFNYCHSEALARKFTLPEVVRILRSGIMHYHFQYYGDLRSNKTCVFSIAPFQGLAQSSPTAHTA